jgi:SAM-dependent methyltransferase
MRYAVFDYYPAPDPEVADTMAGWWCSHWRGRVGLKEDMTDEPLWQTIKDLLTRPGRLLEAGCGTGQWVRFFGKMGCDAVGVDFAPSGLKVGLAANPGLRLIQADFRSLPFDEATFDFVVSFGAVEHDIGGPEQALHEFRRVLKPSGLLMCSVPCLNIQRALALPWTAVRDWLKKREWLRRLAGKTAPFEFYEYMWTPRHYETMLERCGFIVTRLRGYGVAPAPALLRPLGGFLARTSRLHDAHMMIAICRVIG